MILGLEGTDGTGKSSLAEAVYAEVQRRFGADTATLIHKGPPERSVLQEYATDIETTEQHLVFDRWHLGELVYPALYRDQGPYGALDVAGFRWVEKFLQARGATFYVVDLPYETVRERLETRGEDYLQSHHVEGVLQRFREVNSMSVLTRDLLTPPDGLDRLPELARLIVTEAEERSIAAERLRPFRSYVGGPFPDVLLVGERRGGTIPFASQACFMPLKNKSGEYLWNALPDDFWGGVGVANAYEDDIEKLWDALHNPPVVALGGAACAALVGAGIDHGGVPHPQRVKRFFNSKQADYGQLIADVAKSQEERYSWPNS